MPFSLKNVGPAYLQLVNKIFKNQIRRNMVCMDDLLDKSRTFDDHNGDLRETFATIWKFWINWIYLLLENYLAD